MRPWPLLLVGAVALIGASITLIQEGNQVLSISLLTAGLIVLGAWLAIEIKEIQRRNSEGK